MNTTTPPMHEITPGPDHQAVNVALITRRKPDGANALSASVTFGWRAMLKIKHVPEQLFDVTAFPIMFILMFTYLFGGAIAGSTGAYLQYLLPGIMAQTVVMLSMYTGLALNNDIRKGIFDRFRSLPVWQPAVLTGALLGDALRYTIASLMVVVIGFMLGFRPEGGAIGMVMAILLLLVFTFSFSWIWTAIGIVVRSQESLYTLSFIVLFPLTFISNVFVHPETMPPWLQSFVDVNPISILVTAMRGFIHGNIVIADVIAVLLISALLVAIFGPVTMYLFRRQK
ncbi:ABC transporter permease [Balneolales bacterium ANBcel1]|nr:ABC transporter permease [Balneolales bacterium ANBcel1]